MDLESYLKQLEHGNINQRAAAIAIRYGDVDGAHHKQWIIDQMLRIISGAAYPTLMEYFERGGREWDTGIAP